MVQHIRNVAKRLQQHHSAIFPVHYETVRGEPHDSVSIASLAKLIKHNTHSHHFFLMLVHLLLILTPDALSIWNTGHEFSTFL